MIEQLIEMVVREQDVMSRQLANFLDEERSLSQEASYWQSQLSGAPPETMQGAFAIVDWLAYGEKADRELAILAEKDFIVKARISECRDLLLLLKKRQDMLWEVLSRRRLAQDTIARRRQERDAAQRSAARRVVREDEQPWR